MELRFELNGKPVAAEIEAGELLFDVLRRLGCYSVKCGCETTNCGLCTVWVDGKPMLSRSCGTYGKPCGHNDGRTSGRGGEVWSISGKRRGRTVWILFPGIYYERPCHGKGTLPRWTDP